MQKKQRRNQLPHRQPRRRGEDTQPPQQQQPTPPRRPADSRTSARPTSAPRPATSSASPLPASRKNSQTPAAHRWTTNAKGSSGSSASSRACRARGTALPLLGEAEAAAEEEEEGAFLVPFLFLASFLPRIDRNSVHTRAEDTAAKEAQRPGDSRNRNPTSCAASSNEQVRPRRRPPSLGRKSIDVNVSSRGDKSDD
jgi:hypothetical protein